MILRANPSKNKSTVVLVAIPGPFFIVITNMTPSPIKGRVRLVSSQTLQLLVRIPQSRPCLPLELLRVVVCRYPLSTYISIEVLSQRSTRHIVVLPHQASFHQFRAK